MFKMKNETPKESHATAIELFNAQPADLRLAALGGSTTRPAHTAPP
jgi:hypothetical protein